MLASQKVENELKRTYIIILTVVVTIISIVGYVALSPVSLFTETLRVGDVEDKGDGMYIIRVYDKSGGDVAHIAFITGMFTLPSQNMTSVRVSIWHKHGTHLDALHVSFTPSILHHPFHVYLETPPGGKWSPITTESSGEGQAFRFPDLGLYGSGTLTLDFLIRKWSDLPSITITTQIALHDKTVPIVFTQQQATTALTIPYEG